MSTRMLRHYDALGLVQPSGRTGCGYRDYSDEDVRKLFQVEALRSLGLSLKQVGRALDAPGSTPTALVEELIRVTKHRIAQERELLARLTSIRNCEPTGWPEVLHLVELMRVLDSPNNARRQQLVLMQSLTGSVPAEVLADAVLSEDDPNVGGALRWALAHSGAAGHAALLMAARSQDVDKRRRAVLAITELPDETEVSCLLEEVLDDSDPTIRRYAALTLGRRGVESVVPVLVHLVVEGECDVEASEVLGLLTQRNACGDQIVSTLAEALDAPTTTPESRMRLAQALVELGTPAAEQTLRELARDQDPHVARLASALSSRDRRCPRPEVIR